MLHTEYTSYKIFDTELGRGGQGAVVLGMDTCNSKCVAIKFIDLIKEEQIRSFSREIEILERLNGLPYICKTYSVEEIYETGYIIMKQYPFDLFTRAIDSGNSILENDLKKLFRKICLGVKGMHDKNIAHLDIKPENILMDYSDDPFICDFGSAQYFDGIKKSTNSKCIIKGLGRRGTKIYSSPELLSSPFEYDPFKSDIFSLGVTLHVLLTGHFPYDINAGNNIPTIDKSVLPSQACIDILEAMLEIDPSKRISTNKLLLHPWFKNTTNIKTPKVIRYIDKVSKCYTPKIKAKVNSL